MSKLYVNEIAPKTSGGVITGASNIIEMIPMLCDGESYTGISGTYSPTNVTASQSLTTTYVDVNGSSINYTAPSGAVAVMYEFSFSSSWVDSHSIGNFKFFIDGTEVTDARQAIGINANHELVNHFRYIIPIGGTANASTGRQASWSGSKNLKIQTREHSAGAEMILFTSYYWEGANSPQFNRPRLTLTAIGGAYNG